VKARPRVACRHCSAQHAERRDGKRLCERCVTYQRKYGAARPLHGARAKAAAAKDAAAEKSA
jgi:hypothetical protein